MSTPLTYGLVNAARLSCVAALVVLLAGCGSSRSRGNLSGAMDKASNPNNGSSESSTTQERERQEERERDRERERERERDRRREERTPTVVVVTDGGGARVNSVDSSAFVDSVDAVGHRYWRGSPIPDAPASDVPSGPWIGATVDAGLVDQTTYYGIHSVSLRVGGFLTRDVRIDLEGEGAWAPVQTTNALSKSIDGIVTLGLNLRVNWFITPPYTFLGVYLFGGMGYQYMGWSYRNPFPAKDGSGDVISGDGIEGLNIYAGAGFNLVQTRGFQLGLEARPGIALWVGQTDQGYTNNIFSPLWYLRVGPSVVIQF